MRVRVVDRHERILELLGQRGNIRVADLAQQLGVSPVTARRDVDLLERQGALHRRHGVAYALDAGAARGRRVVGHRPGEAKLSVGDDAHIGSGTGSAQVVGMVVPSPAYYYADVMRGARTAVTDAGGRLVIGITDYDLARERDQIRQLLSRGVNALLLTPSWPTGTAPEEEAERVAGLGRPTVLVERRGRVGYPVDELDRVCSAHDHGGYLAVRHLASLGRRRTAFIARESPTAAQLRAGVDAALSHFGTPKSDGLLFTLPADAPIETVLSAVLDQVVVREIDSALVHTDADAVRFAQMVRSRGLRIPDDIAIIAYDDEIAALADPPLTAVAPPKFAVGHAAARLALSRAAELRRSGPGVPLAPGHHVELLPELRIRESCGGAGLRRWAQNVTVRSSHVVTID